MKLLFFSFLALVSQAIALPGVNSKGGPDVATTPSVTTADIASLAKKNPPVSAHSAAAQAGPQYAGVSYVSPTLRYVGHWDKKLFASQYYVSWYGAAQVQTYFTGSTLFLVLSNTNQIPTDLYVTIDSQSVYLNQVYGALNMSQFINFPSTGFKLLTIYSQNYADIIFFDGLVIDGNAATYQPATPSYLFEFVGDSITAGYSTAHPALQSYAYLTSQFYAADYVDLAYPSATLVDLSNAFNGNGMESIYFDTQTPPTSASYLTPWDFTQYTSTHILINLGTNDYFKTDNVTFYSHLTTFLQNLRKQWPSAHLFVIRPFGIYYPSASVYTPLFSDETLAAVQNRNAAGDKNVYWVNTTGWIAASDLTDGVHPNAAGHSKIAGLLEVALYNIASSNNFYL